MDQAGSSDPLTHRPFEILADLVQYPSGPYEDHPPVLDMIKRAEDEVTRVMLANIHPDLRAEYDRAGLVHVSGWAAPAHELLATQGEISLPHLSIERGGLTYPRPGEPLTPGQQARHDRMERWQQERWAEDWLTWPVLDGLSWYCARCRFTGPADEHRGCGNTQLERVRVVVARYFPEPYDDEDDTDSDTSPEQGERTLLAGTDGTDPRAETGWDGDTVTVREQ